ncbi:Lytic enzyme [Cronobacter turicensis 564]|nr:Lytic enzyme [Cronobacter turicensis 564]
MSTPELLSEEASAARSAAWFYTSKGCLKYPGDLLRVTQIINGGQSGMKDRQARYAAARRVL